VMHALLFNSLRSIARHLMAPRVDGLTQYCRLASAASPSMPGHQPEPAAHQPGGLRPSPAPRVACMYDVPPLWLWPCGESRRPHEGVEEVCKLKRRWWVIMTGCNTNFPLQSIDCKSLVRVDVVGRLSCCAE
jgi:hypothetical protein